MRTMEDRLIDYSVIDTSKLSMYKKESTRYKLYNNDSLSPSLRYGEEVNNIVTWIKKKRQEVSGQSEQ